VGDFYADSDLLADRLLNLFGFNNVEKIYHLQSPSSVNSLMLLDETWETGLVSYAGHGSATQLGDGSEAFMVANQVANLENSQLPVFASLTCAAGEFTRPGMPSLSEALVLNPNGGAIVAYSPTGLSINQDAQTIGNAFCDSLYGAGNRIGVAAMDAKIYTSDSVPWFMRRMYIIIGDPAVKAR